MGGKRRFVRCSLMRREVVSQVFCNFGANSGCKCACIAILQYRDTCNAKHHIVAYFTPITGKDHAFICARCDVASATTEFLAKLLRQLVRELRVVGFRVTSVSCDGAAENRRLARELCDVPAKDLIQPHLLFEAAEAAVRAARARSS